MLVLLIVNYLKYYDGSKIDRLKVNKIRTINGKQFRDDKTYPIGIDIRDRIDILAVLYQGGNIEVRAKEFAIRRYNYLMSNSTEESKGQPQMPRIEKETMGWWCQKYTAWISEQIKEGVKRYPNPTTKENIKKYLSKS